MSAERLRAALEERGIAARVEVRDGFALLRAPAALLADARRREAVVALAAEHGFRSVALELEG